MAETAGGETPAEPPETPPAEEAVAEDTTRRDFLALTTKVVTVTGLALASWPFIDSMNPSADILAMATTEVDLTPIQVGQRITVQWQGRPVFIAHRTPEEIAKARADDGAPDLLDPEPDAKRVKLPEWLIVVGVCTHLGCIPQGQRPADNRGDHGGWFCACHGSQYDTSGRVRHRPAPANLVVPAYAFLPNNVVRIG